MTICAIWREEGKIRFAADSRISFVGKSKPFDRASKITQIRMELDLLNPVCQSPEEFFHGNLGACFAGSVINSFVLKETLLQVLSDWLILDCREIPTLKKFIEHAFCQYKKISEQICDCLLSKDGLAEVAMAGYCFNEDRYVAYAFTPNLSNGTFSMQEIASADGEVHFMGSGRAHATKLFKAENSQANAKIITHVLTKLIESRMDPAVGGPLQFGGFDRKHSFKTKIPSIKSGHGC